MKKVVLMFIPALICGVVLWVASSCNKESNTNSALNFKVAVLLEETATKSYDTTTRQGVEAAFREWANSRIAYPPVAQDKDAEAAFCEWVNSRIAYPPVTQDKDAEAAFREWANSRIVYPPVAQDKDAEAAFRE